MNQTKLLSMTMEVVFDVLANTVIEAIYTPARISNRLTTGVPAARYKESGRLVNENCYEPRNYEPISDNEKDA